MEVCYGAIVEMGVELEIRSQERVSCTSYASFKSTYNFVPLFVTKIYLFVLLFIFIFVTSPYFHLKTLTHFCFFCSCPV
jgi:hypothetical protein